MSIFRSFLIYVKKMCNRWHNIVTFRSFYATFMQQIKPFLLFFIYYNSFSSFMRGNMKVKKANDIRELDLNK